MLIDRSAYRSLLRQPSLNRFLLLINRSVYRSLLTLMHSSGSDLFCDTDSYSAHSTALEALWAGVPVPTFPIYYLFFKKKSHYRGPLGNLWVGVPVPTFPKSSIVTFFKKKNSKYTEARALTFEDVVPQVLTFPLQTFAQTLNPEP